MMRAFVRGEILRLTLLVVVAVWASVSSAGPAGNPWGDGTPWAPNTATTWAPATAEVGVDAPAITTWGPATTFPNLVSGQSFSSVPYAASNGDAPFNRGAYVATNPATIASATSYMGSANWSISNVGQYYPGGPTLQPAASAPYNQNLNSF